MAANLVIKMKMTADKIKKESRIVWRKFESFNVLTASFLEIKNIFFLFFFQKQYIKKILLFDWFVFLKKKKMVFTNFNSYLEIEDNITEKVKPCCDLIC